MDDAEIPVAYIIIGFFVGWRKYTLQYLDAINNIVPVETPRTDVPVSHPVSYTRIHARPRARTWARTRKRTRRRTHARNTNVYG